MSDQINLLKTEKTVRQKTSMFFNICLGILILVIAVTAGEIFYRIYLNTRINAVDLEQQETSQQIKHIDAKRVKYQTLKERLNAIQKVYPEIKKFSTRLSELMGTIPAGISVTNVITEGQTIEFRLYSANLASLNTFLTSDLNDISKSKGLGVSKITINTIGINLNPAGYSTSVKFTFNK